MGWQRKRMASRRHGLTGGMTFVHRRFILGFTRSVLAIDSQHSCRRRTTLRHTVNCFICFRRDFSIFSVSIIHLVLRVLDRLRPIILTRRPQSSNILCAVLNSTSKRGLQSYSLQGQTRYRVGLVPFPGDSGNPG